MTDDLVAGRLGHPLHQVRGPAQLGVYDLATAHTDQGSLSPAGWSLFGILFFWQLPHFLAIALYLEEDYRRGGFRVLSVVRGQSVARRRLLLHSIGLAAAGIAPWILGMTGPAYAVTAAVLGATAIVLAARGVWKRSGAAWARRIMLWTLVHQVALVLALVLDVR